MPERSDLVRQFRAQSGYAPQHLDCTADRNEHQRRVWLDCVHAMQEGRIVLAIGPQGVGKTLLSCRLAWYMTQYQERVARYWPFRRWYDAVNAARRDADARPGIDRLIDSPGMVSIDDLQVRSTSSDAEQRAMFDLIDTRYSHRLPLMLITNERREPLQDWLGHALWGRIVERGLIVDATGWPDMRAMAGEARA